MKDKDLSSEKCPLEGVSKIDNSVYDSENNSNSSWLNYLKDNHNMLAAAKRDIEWERRMTLLSDPNIPEGEKINLMF